MVCKKCGQEIADDARFCPSCGQDQTKDVKELFNEEKFKETVKGVSDKVSEAYVKSDKFFANVGDKLCKIAKIVFWIGAIASVIAGLIFAIKSFEWIRWSFGMFLGQFIVSILGAALGVLASWLSSLGLYAFGDLVRRVQAMEERSR